MVWVFSFDALHCLWANKYSIDAIHVSFSNARAYAKVNNWKEYFKCKSSNRMKRRGPIKKWPTIWKFKYSLEKSDHNWEECLNLLFVAVRGHLQWWSSSLNEWVIYSLTYVKFTCFTQSGTCTTASFPVVAKEMWVHIF